MEEQKRSVVGKKESRTEELFSLFSKDLDRLEGKLTSVLKEQTPEKTDKQSEATELNRRLTELEERLASLIRRIEL